VSDRSDRDESQRARFERIAALKAAEDLVEELLREARSQADACRAHLLARGAALPSRLALIVDDIDEIREMYGIALRIAGFQVEEACNGLDGVERALAAPPHVIVMDFAMPVMDGARAIRLLASDERTRHVPILMVSAYADMVPPDVRALCAAFIAKPCEPEELMRQLQVVVDARSPISAVSR
jgi:CheY-like chemotaxis protein